ncbi:hypothetical protein [Candidatus Enterococcus willemsii]|uniref:Uncharacterized protein n=1 Tax=Candidatus Enterococcus willemsii TaxID=1857215 RepID=A0ABQ6Z351_9ENTE|nr:hypothetical protein [Enterococcus sp. CU12B]KAF1306039.1 hypothetical protein BAU17_03480 [Enterococcus sp. CU12B]
MEEKQAIQRYGQQLFKWSLSLLGLAVISVIIDVSLGVFELGSLSSVFIPLYMFSISTNIRHKELTQITGWITAVKILAIIGFFIGILSVFSLFLLINNILLLIRIAPLVMILTTILSLASIVIYWKIWSCHRQMEQIVRK